MYYSTCDERSLEEDLENDIDDVMWEVRYSLWLPIYLPRYGIVRQSPLSRLEICYLFSCLGLVCEGLQWLEKCLCKSGSSKEDRGSRGHSSIS